MVKISLPNPKSLTKNTKPEKAVKKPKNDASGDKKVSSLKVKSKIKSKAISDEVQSIKPLNKTEKTKTLKRTGAPLAEPKNNAKKEKKEVKETVISSTKKGKGKLSEKSAVKNKLKTPNQSSASPKQNDAVKSNVKIQTVKKNSGKDAEKVLADRKKLPQKKKKGGILGKKAYDKRKKLKLRKAKAAKTYEAPEYNEEVFDIICSEENIERTAAALRNLVQDEVAKKKTSIFSDYRYNLNVSCFKIPSCPKRIVKLNLQHSLVGQEDDDVVIVVADVQRGAKADYEQTIQHYEDLFEKHDIKGLKIMPFNQLRKECGSFEAVRKFGNTYDYFLADGRIVGHLVGFCGKIFQKPRTTFHSVHFDKPNLKAEIDRALHRTAYKQLQKGDLISIPIGNHNHSPKEIAENVLFVLKQLKTQYPGGMENVRGIHLKIDIVGTSALPIYLSMSKAPATAPYVVGTREKHTLKLRKDANQVLSNFRLSKDGDLIKLTKQEAERKRKMKETRAKIAAGNNDDMQTDIGEEIGVTSEDGANIKQKSKLKANKKNETDEDDEEEGDVESATDEDDEEDE